MSNAFLPQRSTPTRNIRPSIPDAEDAALTIEFIAINGRYVLRYPYAEIFHTTMARHTHIHYPLPPLISILLLCTAAAQRTLLRCRCRPRHDFRLPIIVQQSNITSYDMPSDARLLTPLLSTLYLMPFHCRCLSPAISFSPYAARAASSERHVRR